MYIACINISIDNPNNIESSVVIPIWPKLEILASVDLWSVQNKQEVGEGQKAM